MTLLRRYRCLLLSVLWSVAALLLCPAGLAAQTRSMAQDSTLDNLRHPDGTETSAPGSLGLVRTVGTAPREG